MTTTTGPPAPDRVILRSWAAVFTFDAAPVITCPECRQPSPALQDVWAAVQWVARHQRDCPA
jgi:hypothetical protein